MSEFSPFMMARKILASAMLTLALLPLFSGVAVAARTVAVMPFENVNKDAALDWVSMGTAETLTTKLLNVEGLVLIERALLLKVMEEQKLQFTGAIDQKTAVQVGKILGAGVLVLGAYQKAGDNIRITARFVDVESAGVLKTAIETGKLDDIFDLQDKIVEDLARNLNIELKEKEIAKLREKPTESLEAYQHFGEGALLQAKKDYKGAVEELKAATKLDPEYAEAKGKLKEVFWSLSKGSWWTYRETSKIGASDASEMETTRRAGGLEDFNGTPANSFFSVTTLESPNGHIISRMAEYYSKGEDGIYWAGMKSESDVKPLADAQYPVTIHNTSTYMPIPAPLMFPYDWKVDKAWKSRFTQRVSEDSVTNGKEESSATSYDVEMDYRIVGQETITVPAGTFDCFVVERKSLLHKGGSSGGPASDVDNTNTYWFTSGVGQVKYRSVSRVRIGNETTQSDGGTTVTNESILKDYHLED